MSNVASNPVTEPLPDGTVTLLFSDIEGSTRLLEHLGPAYPDLLATHHRILRQAFTNNRGHVISAPGDGFFVVFARFDDAVQAAISAQKAISTEAWPEGISVRVRMGLHTGEPMLVVDDYVGIDVHRGARIAAAANGGQILLSSATTSLVGPASHPEAEIVDLGEHRLKDLSLPERLFQLNIIGLPSEHPPPRAFTNQVHNLPASLTTLIGREREVEATKTLLMRSDVRLVSLTGIKRCGKNAPCAENCRRGRRHVPQWRLVRGLVTGP